MRKNKEIQVDGIDRPVHVYELKVKQIKDLVFEKLPAMGTSQNIKETIDLLLNELWPAVCDYPKDKIDDLTPSEIKEIIEAVKEVNEVFWNALDQVGILKDLKANWERIRASLPSVNHSAISALVDTQDLKNMGGSGLLNALNGQDTTNSSITNDSEPRSE